VVVMSVGKLVPKGKNTIKGLVRGKEDAPIFLHITSSEQVGTSCPSPLLRFRSFIPNQIIYKIHFYNHKNQLQAQFSLRSFFFFELLFWFGAASRLPPALGRGRDQFPYFYLFIC
jgi:hypothetical protein